MYVKILCEMYMHVFMNAWKLKKTNPKNTHAELLNVNAANNAQGRETHQIF